MRFDSEYLFNLHIEDRHKARRKRSVVSYVESVMKGELPKSDGDNLISRVYRTSEVAKNVRVYNGGFERNRKKH